MFVSCGIVKRIYISIFMLVCAIELLNIIIIIIIIIIITVLFVIFVHVFLDICKDSIKRLVTIIIQSIKLSCNLGNISTFNRISRLWL